MDLKPTYGTYSCKGKIVKIEHEDNENYSIIKLRIKTSSNSFMRVEAIGKKYSKVKMIPSKKKFNREEIMEVDYKNHRNTPNYRILRAMKLSFHQSTHMEEFTQYDGIHAILKHFEVGDYIYCNGSTQFSKKEDKTYENFMIREMGFVDQSSLPDQYQSSESYFTQDVIFKRLIDSSSFEVTLIVNSKDSYQYIELILGIENSEVYQALDGLSEGQLLTLNGLCGIYVPLIEINGQHMTTDQIVKQLSVTGGDIQDTIYTTTKLQPKGDSKFNKKEFNESKYEF